ncbi:MAG: hypothetical protein V1901_04035 [Patescibacteria group bacterium]
MILFYTKNGERGDKLQQEFDIDTLEIVSAKYIIAIRTSGIQVKSRDPKLEALEEENIIFDEHIDLT